MPVLTQNMVKESAALLPELIFSFMTDEEGSEDPFAKAFPLADRDAWLVSWDQKESPYGLTPQGALDTAPVLMQMPGIRVYEIEPGVYRGFTEIRESELTKGRKPGTLADPVVIKDRLADVMLYFAEMAANRIMKIMADLGTSGKFNNQDLQGNQHSYKIDGYTTLSVTAWTSSPTTATPIDDLRAGSSTLNRGTSSRFGQKSKLLMSDEAVTALLATTQVRSTFKSAYGATFMAPFDHNFKNGPQPPINGDQSLNKLFFGMGLPEIVPWNRGYYPLLSDVQNRTKANYTKFLSGTQAVWLGYRPNNQQLGQFTFARHIGNEVDGDEANYGVVGMKTPESVTKFGKGIYVRVHYINEMPHHYKFEFGFHAAPEVWYQDAMAAVSWS